MVLFRKIFYETALIRFSIIIYSFYLILSTKVKIFYENMQLESSLQAEYKIILFAGLCSRFVFPTNINICNGIFGKYYYCNY